MTGREVKMDNVSRCLQRVVIAGVALGCLFSAAAHAQKSPLGNQDNGGLNGSLSRSDLEKLNGEHGSHGERMSPERAKAQSAKLVGSLKLSCDVTNAQLVVSGTRRVGGRDTPVRVFEVACSHGIGYLLETQGAESPVAISCVAAEEARAADAAKGKEPGFFCKLPENRDVNASVAALIASDKGAECAVQRLQWYGRSESTHADYSEVACQDGKGYLLRTDAPGSSGNTTVMSCAEASQQGFHCRLTESESSEPTVTLETLKTALAQHGVTCKIDPIRLIGQEDHLKRYVVEYRCADSPSGGIAFVPLEGNTNPYQTLDCAAGATRGIACLYPGSAK
jgi:hypothetical protein